MAQGLVRGDLSGSRARGAWVRFVAGVVICGVVVAGCATAPDPGPEPTVAPTTAPPGLATPTEEPTAEEPVEPEVPIPLYATPNERDAEKAAEYFVELYEYVLLSGDLETWDLRGYADCKFCSSISADISSLSLDGIRHQEIQFAVTTAQVVDFDEVLRSFVVEVQYSSTAGQAVAQDGSQVRVFDANDTGYLLLEVGYDPRIGWRLFRAARQEESVL